MTTHEAHESRSPAGHLGRHRLLPITGFAVAVVALLAHIAGGAAVVHLGQAAILAYLGADGVDLGRRVLVIGLVAFGALALLHLPVVLGARRLLAMLVGKRTERTSITTGKTLHRARFYDSHAAFLALGRGRGTHEMTIALAHIRSGDAVLDVGCGTGELTMLASARTGPDGRTSGIDASPEMIAEARRKAAQAGVAIDYRVAAVEALPHPNATFDIVLSSLMMHHLSDDLKDRALAEIRRVLKSDGHLLVVDFRRPTTLRDRLALPFLLHPQWWSLPSGVQDLAPRLTVAGFVAVEAGETDYGPVGYVRARAGLA